MLPLKQKLHEVRRRDRLDLAPERADGEPMNAREQPAVAPLLRLCVRSVPCVHRDGSTELAEVRRTKRDRRWTRAVGSEAATEDLTL